MPKQLLSSACQVLSEIGIASTLESTMYKALLALAASAGAFAPSVHQRATVVQQGVPLANGAMEFDRTAPASGIDRCATKTCFADARALTRATRGPLRRRRCVPRVALQVRGRQGDERVARGLLQGAGRVPARAQEDRRRDGEPCGRGVRISIVAACGFESRRRCCVRSMA
jgi:hypothetical protein